MKILVLCGDKYHPADIVRKGLDPLSSKGFHLDFSEDAAEWPDLNMKDYSAVILSKSNNASETDEAPWMTKGIDKEFCDYVEEGGNLLAIHSGLAGYDKLPGFRKLLGGVFTHHPEMCAVTSERAENCIITSNFKGFTALDEHYFIEMNDPGAEIVIKTVSQHGSQPGGWIRNQGKGHVCAITPGHRLEIWLEPEYQNLIELLIRLR